MRIWHPLIALLLLPSAVLASGALVIQPQVSGTVHILSEGLTGGVNRLTFIQPAGERLTLHILASAAGRCEGDDLAIAFLRLPMQLAGNQRRLACGQPLLLSADTQSQQVAIEVKAQAQQDLSLLLRNGYGARTQIGSVSFNTEEGDSARYPLFLDLSVLQQDVPMLSAAFNKSAIQFGLVGERNDTTVATRLQVGKTLQAGDSILPYTLSFESVQQYDGHYRLRSSLREQFIPYSISIDGREIAPGGVWHGVVPAGHATSDSVDIAFTLSGQAIRGVEAGARLMDTITAVITPEI